MILIESISNVLQDLLNILTKESVFGLMKLVTLKLIQC